MKTRVLFPLALLALLIGCSGEQAENPSLVATATQDAGEQAPEEFITAQDIRNAAGNNAEWLSYGRTYAEDRYSPLSTINRNTVGELGVAWSFELDTNRGQEATPLVIDGVIYFTSAWSKAFAVDARTGEELWRYDPQVPGRYGVNACCDVVNRGMAAWADKVYFGTLDGRLIALDRETGEEAWSVETADPELRYTITGAPRVIDGRVIIGNGGAELGVRGYVSAYDAQSGEMLWRFYTVPGNPADGFEDPALEMAAKTWAGEWWALGGGGTVWDSMAYDPELNLLYIGVGNGSPWNHEIRSNGEGDNLFLSSIVALRPDTGEYVWHFQTTPGESWDYTATQHIMLADIEIDGRERKVLMQAPKNGFFYVIDRTNGEFISGNNYVEINWAAGLDPVTGRPIEAEGIRYKDQPMVMMPGPLGGHNWYPMSRDPATGYVFLPTQNTSSVYSNSGSMEKNNVGWNLGQGPSSQPIRNPQDRARSQALTPSSLIAWNPVTQSPAWRVDYPVYGNSGTLATGGGLVFQGSADGVFHAYGTDDGVEYWSREVGDAILGGPVTYELDGEQYVLALAGQGGAIPLTMGLLSGNHPRYMNGRLIAFKLGATGELSMPEPTPPEPLNTDITTTQGNVLAGAAAYGSYCSVCHGPAALSVGSIPDLRFSSSILNQDAFMSIVLDGLFASRGMASFAADLGAIEVENIRAYLLQQAAAVPR
ncbi:MAG: PQQ-dependent dehydrogenase, methanol/ethanol family [Pseudomonadales bacterium]|nr:PQQ-dependent dehydrogenase, methanol/ethanol family [Pseudomonadales bacterium]MCP5330720.1 PQQ-dependent dehydrogenase, methanol/ethanol family [Pseudomonadales bacterium]MCP5345049.1 PQQ-dependent dehydrogenase, methanol/ethanol family [Pseudomonadales bacterium]